MGAREDIEHILDTHLHSYEPGADDRGVVLEGLLDRFSALASELDELRAIEARIRQFRIACLEANERSFIANLFCSDIAGRLNNILNGEGE